MFLLLIWTYFTPLTSISLGHFEEVNVSWVVILIMDIFNFFESNANYIRRNNVHMSLKSKLCNLNSTVNFLLGLVVTRGMFGGFKKGLKYQIFSTTF